MIRRCVQAVVYNLLLKNFLVLQKKSFSNRVKYRLIKGRVQAHESLEEAIVREVKEEVGISEVKLLRKIWNYLVPLRVRKDFYSEDVTTFLLITSQISLRIGKNARREGILNAYWEDYKKCLKLLKIGHERLMMEKAYKFLKKKYS